MGVVVLVLTDPDLLTLLSHKVRKAGHEVFTTGRGDEGLRLARDRHPNLLIVQEHLDESSGLEVCRSVRRDPDPAVACTAIVVFASTGSEAEAEAAFDAGADDYVVTPFSAFAHIGRLDGEF